MSDGDADGLGASPHILLVEDHDQLRRIIEISLVGAGFRVTTASSGDQARDMLEAGASADLLLSDIRMPGSIDGLQLARWVLTHRPAMAIILQTGFAELKSCEFTVLQKPYSPDELFATIAAKLPSSR
jgi:DNA-binding NtrC family response regulator